MRELGRSVFIGVVTAIVACAADVGAVSAQMQMHGGAAAKDDATNSHAAASVPGTTGKVIETMNAGEYTYALVDDGSKKIWAAAPKFPVEVGDKVVVPSGMPMREFTSKTLGRTFDVVYFVDGIEVVSSQAAKAPAIVPHGAAKSAHEALGSSHTAAKAGDVNLSNIPKAEGGQTVAELYANKAALAGRNVVVRGRVVKFTPQVMNKNWIHVQDGTGSAGSNDLTVSTSVTAAVGNTVLVRGKLRTDRDLGFGYHYDVIIEDGAVTVE